MVCTLQLLTLPVTRVYVEEIAIHMGGSKGMDDDEDDDDCHPYHGDESNSNDGNV
jgi:hypothetical protein